ncbi:helix-turn-helix domain-containing protein [Halovulum sp. GXIMD14793]
MPNQIRKVLGSSVRRIRQERKISSEELARAIDITSCELEQVETAKAAIRLDQLVGLSSALNVPLLSLFSDEVPAANLHP